MISSPVIYGADDRREVYEEVDSGVRNAARSVAVVIPRENITRLSDGTLRPSPVTQRDTLDFCDEERFADQRSLAVCTAALIDDDLLVTAGHCFKTILDCPNYYFAFGYYYYAPDDESFLQSLELHECTQVVVRGVGPSVLNARAGDYAVVQLANKVQAREPIVLRDEPLQKGERLTVLSATNGIPLKVDRGARVLASDPESEHFVLDSDTFEGSSGAPVLDTDGALTGVLVRGNNDYVYDGVRNCFTLNQLPEPDGGRGQDTSDAAAVDPAGQDASASDAIAEPNADEATYIALAIEALCARGYPSQRLCGISARCGDSFCTGSEDPASCPDDCGAREDTADAATADAATADAATANASVDASSSGDAGSEDAGSVDMGSSDAGAKEPEQPELRGHVQQPACSLGHGESLPSFAVLALMLMLSLRRRSRPRPARHVSHEG
ncbi:MAG: serine protease [Myxococcales bacterium]